MRPLIYLAPPPGNTANFPASQPPIPIQMFDPSKPPPPLTVVITAPKNGALKRPAEHANVGPSKARRQGSIVENSLCESCVHRNCRVEVIQEKMQAMECEKTCQTILLDQKVEAYDNGKLLLKSTVNPELYRILDEYIESPAQVAQAPEGMSMIKMSSLRSKSLQKQVLMNMIALAKNIVKLPQSLSQEDLQNLSQTHRQSLPQTHTQNLPQPHTQVLPQTHTHTQTLAQGHPQTQKGTHSHEKGHPLSTSHFQDSGHPQSFGYLQNVAQSQNAVYPKNIMLHSQNASHSQNVTLAATQPVTYVPYQTAVPPPTRMGHAQYPSTSNISDVPNTPYSPVRANTTPAAARPSTSATTPHNTYSYGMARYSHLHYYPPFQ